MISKVMKIFIYRPPI